MGLVYVVMEMTRCINITFLVKKLSHFKLMFLMLLAHLGLLKPPSPLQEVNSQEDPTATGYVLVIDGPNPSIVTVPLHILTSLIKKSLPVVQYSSFIERFGAHNDDEDTNSVCSVCLECIERNEDIRELRNCSHLFHRKCLDYWVDEGQVTCPLCRSLLFPAKGEMISY
ncbi:E3 ubiquitin-protein ligase RHA2B-like [Pistacia vera]|uniref:E3 ubiquitin-protein ligase RHA2B-like n=1 Tax=Pistacia vera TaxID=55513 RepID=UPI00126395DC|nr:E3 ubiquitin-protein ligase RHA2B-like [Pistacia vera]